MASPLTKVVRSGCEGEEYGVDTLDIPSNREQGVQEPTTPHDCTHFKIYELCVSGFFCGIVSDQSSSKIAEIWKQEPQERGTSLRTGLWEGEHKQTSPNVCLPQL